MRLQFAEFVEKESGLTESAAVENILGADIIYLTVISESTPGVTVELLTDGDPDTGTWVDGTIMTPAGTELESVTENGLYYVLIAGAKYVRVKNEDADDTLWVYGAFDKPGIMIKVE